MTLITIVGDCTTTTAVALVSAWSDSDDAVLVEADRSGGSLAAWLDTPISPSLSTIVANSHTLDVSTATAWQAIEPMIQRSRSGVRFISCPVRSREANRTIAEAESIVFPLFANTAVATIVADLGSYCAADGVPRVASLSSAIVVCHRQSAASVAAAAVQLERLAEAVETLSMVGVPLIVALIGDRPFDGDEVQRFVTPDGQASIPTCVLPVDDLTAAVFAGRTGVSERRLNRLPLMRTARDLAGLLRETVSSGIEGTSEGRPDWSGAGGARSVRR